VSDEKSRTRGRPRVFDGTPVSVRLPSAVHDALSVEAVRRGVPMADVIRERLSDSRISKIGAPPPTVHTADHT
jgi:hypothetical protein